MFKLLRKVILMTIGVLDLLEEKERRLVDQLVDRGRSNLARRFTKEKRAA